MSEHDEVGTRLASALHAEAETVRPEPALQSILARARQAPARSVARRWWPALAGAVAAGALVAVAIVVFSGSPTSEPPVIGSGQREVTVYFTNADDKLVPEQVTVPDTGDPGTDAVTALIYNQPRDNDYLNEWHGLSVDANDSATAGAQVLSVQAVDGVITVDLDSHVPEGMAIVDCGSPRPGACHVPNGRVVVQQLVYTLHANLHTDAPVVVTDRGDPATAMFGWEVGGPTAAVEPSRALAMIQIESPAQGETVASPVTVSGQSATFEGNVVWRVKQDGTVVDRGYTTSQGANGAFGPFEFTVELPAGDYTVEAYEESAENGEIINLDSKDFTVE